MIKISPDARIVKALYLGYDVVAHKVLFQIPPDETIFRAQYNPSLWVSQSLKLHDELLIQTLDGSLDEVFSLQKI
ncbi:hypothetical protein [Candidatus Lokiarchaeum ossiferum]|uniref:hypothetical protein n=1 Tax=Candidatus Lokiarchaeum ossiferum TaxID=2951803 RepID=UPI00352EFB86